MSALLERATQSASVDLQAPRGVDSAARPRSDPARFRYVTSVPAESHLAGQPCYWAGDGPDPLEARVVFACGCAATVRRVELRLLQDHG
jgi:hypothetical protein